MKKVITIFGAMAICVFLTGNAYSAAYSQTNNIVTVSAANITEADDVVFQASAQVTFSGASVETNYAHAAFHDQVVGKKNGRQFGMTGEVSSIYWQSIESGTTTTINVTNSSLFSSWTKM